MSQDTTNSNWTFEKFKKKIIEKKELQDDEKDQASKRSRRDQFEDKDRDKENRPSRAKSEYQPRNLEKSEIISQNRPRSHSRGARRITTIEALIEESKRARLDKQLIFDLSQRSMAEINDWLKTSAPSKIRRSEGVGWISVLSKSITPQEKKKIFESVKEENTDLQKEWEKITQDSNIRVTFQTFKDLAEKHDCKMGKWLARGDKPDDFWTRIVMDFAHEKFPKETIALKISPVNDVDMPGASGPNAEHLMCIINRDMTKETEVLEVEKAIRNVPIRCNMQYKPVIYTDLGIYRGNKYAIRPTIYTSERRGISDGKYEFKVENVAEEDWHYLPYRERNSNGTKTESKEDTDMNNNRSPVKILDESPNKSPGKGQGRGSNLQRMLAALRQSKKSEEKKVIDVETNEAMDVDKGENDAKETKSGSRATMMQMRMHHTKNKEDIDTKSNRTPITWP